MLNLPYSKARRYLTGIDWVIHSLDYMTRQATGIGNLSQIVLELEGTPDEARLRSALTGFVRKFPVVHGRPARDCINLAPYWKIPSSSRTAPVPIDVHRMESGSPISDVHSVLGLGVNTPFPGDRDHLSFRLVYAGKKSYLAMTFDHRLFDAWGAEAFLNAFQQEWETGVNHAQPADLAEPAHLCRWAEKLEAGRQLNRTLLQLAENASPCTLPLPPGNCDPRFRFKIAAFDEEQTKTITEAAYRDAGYLMIMPYTVAASALALHRVFAGKGVSAGDYMISVSIDMRPFDKRPRDVFFNHLSFLLFRIEAAGMDDFPGVVNEIKRQMYDQVKSKLPQNLQETCFLMRIAPLPLMGYVMRKYLKGQVASFCFSCVRESGYSSDRFMGERVHNLFHMPRVPVLPGIGIFFNRFHGKLNATLSYLNGLLDDDEADNLIRDLETRLGV